MHGHASPGAGFAGPAPGDGGRVRSSRRKMSLLPNVAGQLAGGAGAATGEPLASDCRKASTAGQSAALRRVSPHRDRTGRAGLDVVVIAEELRGKRVHAGGAGVTGGAP